MSKQTITIEVDQHQLFDMVAAGGDGGVAVGQRLACVLLGDTSAMTLLGLGVYGIAVLPLATPKPSPTPKGGLPGRGEGSFCGVREALVEVGFCATTGEADRLIRGGGAYINDVKVTTEIVVAQGDRLRAGKKNEAIFRPLAPAEAIRDGGEGGEG